MVNYRSRFVLLWLDRDHAESNETNGKYLDEFESSFDQVETATSANRSLKVFKENPTKNFIVVLSSSLVDEIRCLDKFQSSIHSIFVLQGKNDRFDKEKLEKYRIRGFFTSPDKFLNAFRREVRQIEQAFSTSNALVDPSLVKEMNQLDAEFLFCELLKENFAKMEHEHSSIDEFIEYATKYCTQSAIPLSKIDDFRHDYRTRSRRQLAIFWYQEESFLYKMLNKALREFSIEALLKLSFFIRDLHQEIADLQQTSHGNELTVYRVQFLSKKVFETKLDHPGTLWYFNCFLSTSKNADVAKEFSSENKDPELIRVLFVIKVDPAIEKVPFAFIFEINKAYQDEEEVLFSIGTVFRLEKIVETGDLPKIYLKSTSDRDSTLTNLRNYIRRSIEGKDHWHQLADLLIKTGKYRLAQQIYQQLIQSTDEQNHREMAFLSHQIGFIEKTHGDLKRAFDFYQQSLSHSLKYLPADHPQLSSTYSNIAAIMKKLKMFDDALKTFLQVLRIDENSSPPNQLEIATDHHNVASVLDEQGKYEQALEHYEKSFSVKSAVLPADHLSLAATLIGIGVVHRKMGNAATALLYYKRALDIQKKNLVQNHPGFINTYTNMATALEASNRTDEAIQCLQQAENVAKVAYGDQHPDTRRQVSLRQKLEERYRR